MGSPSPLPYPLSFLFLSHLPIPLFSLPAGLAHLPPPRHPLFPGSHRLALGYGRRLPRNNPRPLLASFRPQPRISRDVGPFRLSSERHLVGHPSHGPQRRPSPRFLSLSPRSPHGRSRQPPVPTLDTPVHRNNASLSSILLHPPSPLRRHLLCRLPRLETPFPPLRPPRPAHPPSAT